MFSLETVTVKTVKSRTGGVHKRFTTPGSSNSDSDEAEETKKGLKISNSNQYHCEHNELFLCRCGSIF